MSKKLFNLQKKGFGMKTDILKFKIILLATALSCVGTVGAGNFSSEASSKSEIEELLEKQDDSFLELIILRIKDTIKGINDLINSFLDKNNKESYAAYLARCKKQLENIEQSILAPLRAKLEIVSMHQSGSSFHRFLERAYLFANDMVYIELKNLVKFLEDYKNSKDPKKTKAPNFIDKLKPFSRLTTPEALESLEKKITELSGLITQQSERVKQEVNSLINAVKKLRTNPPVVDKLAALTAISNKLKTL